TRGPNASIGEHKVFPGIYACCMRLTTRESDLLFRAAMRSGLATTSFSLKRDLNWSGIYHSESNSHFLVHPLTYNFLTIRGRMPLPNIYRSYNVKMKVKDARETLHEGVQWSNVERLVRSWVTDVASQNSWTASEE